ncbi:hypothetical protein N0O92_07930 [Alkalihalobacillus sp. MEB130]|uniref:hypothetical protein n=1 Tax=Alkalihalobacillus sp. MEB130 TaxID=2976704 RepID=UPI0028DE8B58|nr:hypothetical protein [Alkalihalobacillus sp. MEB130]MDT8860159.1 hypothetical protein [Alkalihalobacillus sp. MEB130]
MDKVQNRLRASLLENRAIQIKESAMWYVHVKTFDVAFTKVKRSKMDILMKMILLAVEQTDIRRAANLSEMLLVEELFITDLMEKMQRSGLLQLERAIYKLTAKGHEQLQTGIVEEEMEEEWTELFYSPAHDEFWHAVAQPGTEEEEDWSLYRYAQTQDEMNKERMLDVLTEQENGLDEEGFQTVVSEVNRFEQKTIDHVACLEFQLYNQEQDLYYVRVWNTWLERWDDILEKQIEEHERIEWRRKWTKDEEVSE